MLNQEEILQSGNLELAQNLKRLIHSVVDKANDMVDNAERADELYTAIKIAEVAGKITGIVREKQTINMQINQISGFTFIEIDKPAIIQEEIKTVESYSQLLK